jgi:UDP-N-acetylmuramyl pentapeptide phosphotransferase/UDP-N-acetylglucosamine-1-phosphate transferase
MTTHASGSISLGGMFATISVFGDQVPEQLTTMSPGNPFVVHVNSQAEYDYCP